VHRDLADEDQRQLHSTDPPQRVNKVIKSVATWSESS
jgi:hypothetical protein